MREMWELPAPRAGARVLRAVMVLVMAWAVVAVPLTLWLTLRTPPAEPPPRQRALSALEDAAVRYAGESLSTAPVTLSSTVISAVARLEVDQTIDVDRGVSYGKVRSGAQSADLMVSGDRVLLRSGPAFWSTVGVPTSDPGWIEVGDRLGTIPFPLGEALGALTPDPHAQVDTSGPEATTATFRNGGLAAEFSDTGVVKLTIGDRTAEVSRPDKGTLAQLASAPVDQIVGAAKLTGISGALTVSATPEPPPPPPPTDTPAP